MSVTYLFIQSVWASLMWFHLAYFLVRSHSFSLLSGTFPLASSLPSVGSSDSREPVNDLSWRWILQVWFRPDKNEFYMKTNEAFACVFVTRIKRTSPYENTWIYYTLIVVNILHVSVTVCGHLQEGVFTKYILQTPKPMYKDGHKRWPKHVGGLQRCKCNKFAYFHMNLLLLFP
jgi:hypothetical protein